MNRKPALAKLSQHLVVTRNQITPTVVVAILLFLSPAHFLQAQNRSRGDAIGGAPITSTNVVSPTSGAQTNTDFAWLVVTNAAGECIINFGVLSSYPMHLPHNLISNTNQAA
jgi:hypothetical protein